VSTVIVSLLYSLRFFVQSRASLHLEIIALRHQLAVVNRSRRPRLRFTAADRLLWAWLAQAWRDWRLAVLIVKPETVIAWHRRGFRLFWTWKSRRRTGRPGVPPDVRALIRELSTANPLWGAPRIHGELLKLGFAVSQSDRGEHKGPLRARTHLALGKDTPVTRPVLPLSAGRIVATPQVGGLHHRYDRIAA
jgi:putative transposase